MRGDFRVSIAGLLWLVAVSGLWLASLRYVSVVWTSLSATMTLAALLAAVLGAVVDRGERRAFWMGFALFGWVYLILVEWDWVGGQFGHDLTGGLSDLAEQWLPPVTGRVPSPAVLNPPLKRATAPPPDYVEAVQQRAIKIGNFVEIGRMTLSLVFGTVGGLIGRAMAAQRGPG